MDAEDLRIVEKWNPEERHEGAQIIDLVLYRRAR
jgi:hypothetical protein